MGLVSDDGVARIRRHPGMEHLLPGLGHGHLEAEDVSLRPAETNAVSTWTLCLWTLCLWTLWCCTAGVGGDIIIIMVASDPESAAWKQTNCRNTVQSSSTTSTLFCCCGYTLSCQGFQAEVNIYIQGRASLRPAARTWKKTRMKFWFLWYLLEIEKKIEESFSSCPSVNIWDCGIEPGTIQWVLIPLRSASKVTMKKKGCKNEVKGKCVHLPKTFVQSCYFCSIFKPFSPDRTHTHTLSLTPQGHCWVRICFHVHC